MVRPFDGRDIFHGVVRSLPGGPVVVPTQAMRDMVQRPSILVVLLTCALAGAGACASYSAPETEVVAPENRQRDVITREEIQASPHRQVDLYQAVRGLRPHFLAPPTGNRTRTFPTALYIDGIRQQSGLRTLATIPASEVDRVEYLDPTRAESQYGSTAAGGAVLVTLSGQRRAPQAARDSTLEF